jgi:hypothetical protein
MLILSGLIALVVYVFGLWLIIDENFITSSVDGSFFGALIGALKITGLCMMMIFPVVFALVSYSFSKNTTTTT